MSMLMSGLLRKRCRNKTAVNHILYTFHKPYIILMSHKTEAEKAFIKAVKAGAVPDHHFSPDRGFKDITGSDSLFQYPYEDEIGVCGEYLLAGEF